MRLIVNFSGGIEMKLTDITTKWGKFIQQKIDKYQGIIQKKHEAINNYGLDIWGYSAFSNMKRMDELREEIKKLEFKIQLLEIIKFER